jgi:pantetheine-phosphate adenylyltransferase
MVTAIFPGSFDPLTNGHTDVINRCAGFFDKIIVAVLANQTKNTLFTPQERVELLRQEFKGWEKKFAEKIEVTSFSGLLIDFARANKTRIIIRGLRAVSDYEYEAQMAIINRTLAEEVETFFLMAREKNAYISSSIVKQVASAGGDVSGLVPKIIEKALIKKYKQNASKTKPI